MNKLKLCAIGLVLAGGLSAQTNCQSLTKDSAQCKNTTKQGDLCYLHNPNYVKNVETKSVICNGITKKDKSCKNKTKNYNGFCHLHQNQQ